MMLIIKTMMDVVLLAKSRADGFATDQNAQQFAEMGSMFLYLKNVMTKMTLKKMDALTAKLNEDGHANMKFDLIVRLYVATQSSFLLLKIAMMETVIH